MTDVDDCAGQFLSKLVERLEHVIIEDDITKDCVQFIPASKSVAISDVLKAVSLVVHGHRQFCACFNQGYGFDYPTDPVSRSNRDYLVCCLVARVADNIYISIHGGGPAAACGIPWQYLWPFGRKDGPQPHGEIRVHDGIHEMKTIDPDLKWLRWTSEPGVERIDPWSLDALMESGFLIDPINTSKGVQA